MAMTMYTTDLVSPFVFWIVTENFGKYVKQVEIKFQMIPALKWSYIYVTTVILD